MSTIVFRVLLIKYLSLFKHYYYAAYIRLKRLTLKRLVNLAKIEYAFFKKKTIVNGYPYEIVIEPTNICQLKCPLCFTGTGSAGREKGFMGLAAFQKMIDTLGPYAFHVYLHLWGESFLHRDLNRFIQYSPNANLSTTVSSNLSFQLEERRAKDIIRSGLDVLVVGLDGVTAEVYNRYRVGGNFDQVIVNIKLFARLKKELGSKTPYIKWHFIVTRQNSHQVEAAKELSKELGTDSIVFASVFLRDPIDNATKEKWLPVDKHLGNQKVFDKPNELIGGCWWLWRGVVVNWDGAISPCCTIADKTTDFALFDQDFKRVWNNPHYQAARQLFTGDKRASGLKTVCHDCGVVRYSQ